jgi:hypothetical protein
MASFRTFIAFALVSPSDSLYSLYHTCSLDGNIAAPGENGYSGERFGRGLLTAMDIPFRIAFV